MTEDLPWRARLNPALSHLSIYDVPPSRAPARMHANESPEQWSPAAMRAVASAVADVELNRYPDTSGRDLRAILGERHQVDPTRIVLGNGSDEIISLLLTALLHPGADPHLVIPTPTFVMYAHSAHVLGFKVTEVPLTPAFQLDMEAMRHALTNASICFLARPNNPTSSLWDADEIRSLVQEFPRTIFVIDEAYGAYAPGASLYDPNGPSNQVHMTTLSKVGLAALRLGYCVAHPVLATALNKCRHPYNISATTLAIAETLLRDHSGELDDHLARNLARRDQLIEVLRGVPDAEVFPAHANLVLCRLTPASRAPSLAATLAEGGVRVKDVSGTPGLEGCLRISLGSEGELRALAAVLQTVTPSSAP
ncbi:MAG: pyridoxal phosphate-dependent aminotransferase [Nannocystaceae bacterium]